MVEDENKDFAQRYVEVEEQNNNLANLYVASYQLHSTLDFQEVVHIVMEIIINLIGAEIFSIMLLDEKTNELGVIANEGYDDGFTFPTIRIGSGIIGGVAKSGNPTTSTRPAPTTRWISCTDCCHPAEIKENVIGVINIHKLLVQKDAFTAVDYELFSCWRPTPRRRFSPASSTPVGEEVEHHPGLPGPADHAGFQGLRAEEREWKGCAFSS